MRDLRSGQGDLTRRHYRSEGVPSDNRSTPGSKGSESNRYPRVERGPAGSPCGVSAQNARRNSENVEITGSSLVREILSRGEATPETRTVRGICGE